MYVDPLGVMQKCHSTVEQQRELPDAKSAGVHATDKYFACTIFRELRTNREYSKNLTRAKISKPMVLSFPCCRLELLKDAPHTHDDLLLLLNTTDVLASCCEGTNPFIESICQTIFSVEELLEVCWGVRGRRKGVGGR